jgi:hypothetical protein
MDKRESSSQDEAAIRDVVESWQPPYGAEILKGYCKIILRTS